ncbi:MAG: TIM barrel protein, partial [Planctomycetes bacterium]|nr:TIM barrel protein [Planctomycetota bacterium]
LTRLASGEVDLLIGTHAVLERDVRFRDLGVVVIDEQHKFGVAQRAALRQKGTAPHVLVLSATPIPRTLAMTVFGDLDVSTIDGAPPNRQPIATRLVTPDLEGEAWRFVQQRLAAHEQAYIVYPLVEDFFEHDMPELEGQVMAAFMVAFVGLYQAVLEASRNFPFALSPVAAVASHAAVKDILYRRVDEVVTGFLEGVWEEDDALRLSAPQAAMLTAVEELARSYDVRRSEIATEEEASATALAGDTIMRKISMGSWAYTTGPTRSGPMPWDEVVATLKELGFDGIELGALSPHPNPQDMPDPEQRDICRERLQATGLGWSALTVHLHHEHLIDTEDTRAYLHRFRQYLQFCVDLGIPIIRVDTVQSPRVLAAVDYESARKRVGETWRRCAAEAEDRGVMLLWEFEPGFAFNKPTDVFRIIEAVNHDNFGILFDTCHAHMVAVQGARQSGTVETLAGGIPEFARKLRGTIHHLHLMDSDGTLDRDRASTRTLMGEGLINFEDVLLELAKHDMRQDWWTLDLGKRPDVWQATETCKQAVDGLNERYG